MQKLLITGPESTGKSSLCRALASHFEDCWVPEYARLWMEKKGPEYQESDLLEMAKGQVLLEDYLAQTAKQYLFCDTGMLVMKVWSEFKYGRCHPWILEQWHTRTYDHYVLCDIDMPWAAGPFRENPDERVELFMRYQQELELTNRPCIILSGSLEERLQQIIRLLAKEQAL
jgi:NadR type nicotinamide-nucleotide adenylyltransferase